jgi:hypothetical protein
LSGYSEFPYGINPCKYKICGIFLQQHDAKGYHSKGNTGKNEFDIRRYSRNHRLNYSKVPYLQTILI